MDPLSVCNPRRDVSVNRVKIDSEFVGKYCIGKDIFLGIFSPVDARFLERFYLEVVV